MIKTYHVSRLRFQLSVKGLASYAEKAGGFGYVSVGLVQSAFDQDRFGLLKV